MASSHTLLEAVEREGCNRNMLCWTWFTGLTLKTEAHDQRKDDGSYLVILLYCLYASTFPYFLSADSCSQKVLSEDVILKRICKWNQKASEEAKPQAMVCHWQKEATMWERLVRRWQAILHLPVQVWKPQKPPTIEKSDIKISSYVFIIYPNWHQMKLCIEVGRAVLYNADLC